MHCLRWADSIGETCNMESLTAEKSGGKREPLRLFYLFYLK
jgi:hypothetical protein